MKVTVVGRFVLVALAVLASVAAPVYGQLLHGSLVGNVRDATEAAVTAATVTVINIQTNQSRQALSNDVGSYSLPTLEPGNYTLRVTKEGFSTFTQTDVIVSINSITRIDVALRIGAVTETVTVSGQVAALQTDRSEVRAEITSQTFQNLPVAAGRNYQQLFRMLPASGRPPTRTPSRPTRRAP